MLFNSSLNYYWSGYNTLFSIGGSVARTRGKVGKTPLLKEYYVRTAYAVYSGMVLLLMNLHILLLK